MASIQLIFIVQSPQTWGCLALADHIATHSSCLLVLFTKYFDCLFNYKFFFILRRGGFYTSCLRVRYF